MPSSCILSKHVPNVESLDDVMDCLETAAQAGLQVEWMAWFIGGVRQGLPLNSAAQEALQEWDMI